MKRSVLLVLVALTLAGVLLAGCNGVVMNAAYSDLLDRTAALSAQTAQRADAGQLSADEMTQALHQQAVTWQKFKDAKDGKKGGEQ